MRDFTHKLSDRFIYEILYHRGTWRNIPVRLDLKKKSHMDVTLCNPFFSFLTTNMKGLIFVMFLTAHVIKKINSFSLMIYLKFLYHYVITYTLKHQELCPHCHVTIIRADLLCGCFPSFSSLIFETRSAATICQKRPFMSSSSPCCMNTSSICEGLKLARC